jgi:hypothetical protein
MLAALVRKVAGPGAAGVPLEELERRVVAGVRELGCAVLQHALDVRAAAEVRLAQVTGVDGVTRPLAGRGTRTIVTVLGPVRVRRIGYRARVRGVRALFPADAALNLPRRRYSWGLQELAVLFTQAGSYGQARRFVRAATGISIGKRQLEQITAGPPQTRPGSRLPCPRGRPGRWCCRRMPRGWRCCRGRCAAAAPRAPASGYGTSGNGAGPGEGPQADGPGRVRVPTWPPSA